MKIWVLDATLNTHRVHGIGVSIGYWLSKKLTPETLDLSVGILLLIITAWLVSDVLAMS